MYNTRLVLFTVVIKAFLFLILTLQAYCNNKELKKPIKCWVQNGGEEKEILGSTLCDSGAIHIYTHMRYFNFPLPHANLPNQTKNMKRLADSNNRLKIRPVNYKYLSFDQQGGSSNGNLFRQLTCNLYKLHLTSITFLTLHKLAMTKVLITI